VTSEVKGFLFVDSGEADEALDEEEEEELIFGLLTRLIRGLTSHEQKNV
jgi:hypothetical protein